MKKIISILIITVILFFSMSIFLFATDAVVKAEEPPGQLEVIAVWYFGMFMKTIFCGIVVLILLKVMDKMVYPRINFQERISKNEVSTAILVSSIIFSVTYFIAKMML